MTLNDDEAALAFGEAGIAEDAFDAATYVRDLREAGYVVARLSHDQGADDPVYDELYRIVHQAPFHPEAGGISVHFSIEDIKRQKAVLAERALSVPAPTLPALDALDVEVRPNEDGTVDEVIINVGGRCVFHLEQMDDDAYWFAIYTNPDPMADSWAFWMNRKGKRLLLKETERPAEALRDAV